MKTRHYFGALDALQEGQFSIKELGNRSVGATLHQGKPVVVLNFCPHAGAPICRGKITPSQYTDAEYQLHLDAEHPVLRCPWHGWEFSLESGGLHFESRLRLAFLEYELDGTDLYVWI